MVGVSRGGVAICRALGGQQPAFSAGGRRRRASSARVARLGAGKGPLGGSEVEEILHLYDSPIPDREQVVNAVDPGRPLALVPIGDGEDPVAGDGNALNIPGGHPRDSEFEDGRCFLAAVAFRGWVAKPFAADASDL